MTRAKPVTFDLVFKLIWWKTVFWFPSSKTRNPLNEDSPPVLRPPGAEREGKKDEDAMMQKPDMKLGSMQVKRLGQGIGFWVHGSVGFCTAGVKHANYKRLRETQTVEQLQLEHVYVSLAWINSAPVMSFVNGTDLLKSSNDGMPIARSPWKQNKEK